MTTYRDRRPHRLLPIWGLRPEQADGNSAPQLSGRRSWPSSDVVCFDASAVVHTRSSSRRPPDPLTAGLLPQRSPPRLLTDAACGGLGSPPARRTRRAHLHHWYSTLHAGDLLHRHHSTSGHTWGSRTRPWPDQRFQAAGSYWLIRPPGLVDAGSCHGPARGPAISGAADAAAALDAAAGCCSAPHTGQARCAGVAPRRSASGRSLRSGRSTRSVRRSSSPADTAADLDHLDTRVRQDRVERGRELSRTIADQEPEPGRPVRRGPYRPFS